MVGCDLAVFRDSYAPPLIHSDDVSFDVRDRNHLYLGDIASDSILHCLCPGLCHRHKEPGSDEENAY